MFRALLSLLLGLSAQAADPIRLHPANPHYFEFRSKPTVLITSAEHYGAVINAAFDTTRYLDTLQREGMNMTRVFAGLYRETPRDFGIFHNTLAPEEKDFLSPYSAQGWNPRFFERLRTYVADAGRRDIVVEVTLFCTFYQDYLWRSSPLYDPAIPSTEPLTLKHPRLVQKQDEFVRKVVSELREFDNVIFEICNEPYFNGVTLEWQAHIAKVIAETSPRHLIAQNIANNQQLITRPDPNVSLFNFHYARPPVTVDLNYHLGKAIGLDETGFDGTMDAAYRIQGWDFLLAGGAHYNNLDYSFAVGNEDGTQRVSGDQPGGGSATLRKHLRNLRDFMAAFDFIRMKPDPNVVSAGVPEGASVRVLAEPGRQVALYLHHGRVMSDYRPRYLVRTSRQQTTLTLQLPPGAYTARWWDPKSGRTANVETFTHTGSGKQLTTPQYTEDIALELKAR